MNTECIQPELKFQAFGRQEVIVTNDGDVTSSDGGLVLLQQIDKRFHIIQQFSACFFDNRNPNKVLHSLPALLTQRVFGLCQGYEDLNDHDEWRKDPLVGMTCGKGENQHAAGKSTLNRLELGKEVTLEYGARYNKIDWDEEAMEQCFIDLFLKVFPKPKGPIILDVDATDDPLHGHQEGRFFHGYYDSYCYLPLYVFCGEYLVAAKLRTANRDASDGCTELLEKIVTAIRKKYPKAQIIVRGDSGFCREHTMKFCEGNRLFYIFGLARNKRLRAAIGKYVYQAKQAFQATGEPSRTYAELWYKTRKSWSRTRRVVGKAEYLPKGENPRFVVTNLSEEQYPAKQLYEALYCARGNMENRIKEQQLYLFADRTSTSWMSSNQLRLWFSSLAYMFLCILRNHGLKNTDARRYQAETLRLKLLKVAAQVSFSCRRIRIRLPRSFPYWNLWVKVHEAFAVA